MDNNKLWTVDTDPLDDEGWSEYWDMFDEVENKNKPKKENKNEKKLSSHR